MTKSITYEQPLNERVRTFLRIEHLFDLVNHSMNDFNRWSSIHSLTSLLDIVDLLGRSDIKTELIKELERHISTLTALEKNPGVDSSRLKSILDDISEILMQLREPGYQPGQIIRQDELLTTLKQRNSIPGGSCCFDLPNYHHWLHKTEYERRTQLHKWQEDLIIIKKGVLLALQMIRNSTNPSSEIAETGFFQRPMEPNLSCQLIRVRLPIESPYFPEISGGKHRFTIRFLQQENTGVRPLQTSDDVEFDLHCCIL